MHIIKCGEKILRKVLNISWLHKFTGGGSQMRVELIHPQFRLFEQTKEGILLHKKDEVISLYSSPVLASAVTLSGPTLLVAAAVDTETITYWYGDDNLRSQEFKIGSSEIITGLKLVTDSSGIIHLFYLLYNRAFRHTSYTLVHHIFQSKAWSDPVRVTTNINKDISSWQICFGLDKFMHLVYINQAKNRLLYRSFNLETGLWSGAITLDQEQCDQPQIYENASGLTIIWTDISDQGKCLQVMQNVGTWSKAEQLSARGSGICRPGFFLGPNPTVMWMDGNKLYQSNFTSEGWSQPGEFSKLEYDFSYQTVIEDENKGCCTLRIYRKKASFSPIPDTSTSEIPTLDSSIPDVPIPISDKLSKGVNERQNIDVVGMEQKIFERLEFRLKQQEKAFEQKRLELRAATSSKIERIEAQISRSRLSDTQVKNLELAVAKMEKVLKGLTFELGEIKAQINKKESKQTLFRRILSRF